jgi:hypothetical protein
VVAPSLLRDAVKQEASLRVACLGDLQALQRWQCCYGCKGCGCVVNPAVTQGQCCEALATLQYTWESTRRLMLHMQML